MLSEIINACASGCDHDDVSVEVYCKDSDVDIENGGYKKSLAYFGLVCEPCKKKIDESFPNDVFKSWDEAMKWLDD